MQDTPVVSDPRIPLLADVLGSKGVLEAEEVAWAVVATLEDFYGAKRYWMCAEFERERIIREVELLGPRCSCKCCSRIVDLIRGVSNGQ